MQDKAHKASLENTEELAPPTNPDLLYLNIDEWKLRIPLTMETFDLIYGYLEDGATEKVSFTYRRLVNADLCVSDIGLLLTRTTFKNEPPFTPANPAPVAQVGKHYFYTELAKNPCYKTDDPSQVALVKKIAGEQSLTEFTNKLLAKMVAIPKE